MAIVVPLLIGSTGIGAAAAAAIGISAGTLATVAGIAFQVTGINDKINKAASKVFGEDLVNVANIFGTVYSAATGSWDISDEVNGIFGGGAEGVATTVDDLYKPTTLTPEAWEAAGVANMEAATAAAADMTAAGTTGVGTEQNLFGAKAPTEPAVTDVNGYDLNTETTNSPSSVGTDTKEAAFSQSKQATTTQTATGQQGATSAVAAQAQSVPNAAAPSATSAVKAPGAPGAAGAQSGSFFDKLKNNKLMTPLLVSGAISGLAKGYSSGQAEKMAERRFNTELERLKNRPRVTYTIGSKEA